MGDLEILLFGVVCDISIFFVKFTIDHIYWGRGCLSWFPNFNALLFMDTFRSIYHLTAAAMV